MRCSTGPGASGKGKGLIAAVGRMGGGPRSIPVARSPPTPPLVPVRRGLGDRLVGFVLVKMLSADLRCLDAHAHLGNFVFHRRPEDAIRHYEVGVRIGELSLSRDFDGVLPWGRVDNRPFLRCLQGFGLCLWRLGRHQEAVALFERMLWLNPTDNQGVQSLLPPIRAGEQWQDRHGDE